MKEAFFSLPYHTALFQILHKFLYQQKRFLVQYQTKGFPYPPVEQKRA